MLNRTLNRQSLVTAWFQILHAYEHYINEKVISNLISAYRMFSYFYHDLKNKYQSCVWQDLSLQNDANPDRYGCNCSSDD
jgi:hypothetical protein